MISRRLMIGGAAVAAAGAIAWYRFDSRPIPFRDHPESRNHAKAQAAAGMAAFAPRYIRSKDGTPLRTAVFAAPSPGKVCLLATGRGEFIEKYVEVIGELNARGFTVVIFDWRGQGGSARLLANPLKGYVRDFADYEDDLFAVLDRVAKPLSPQPLLLAHSMGGNVALRALHDRPGAFHAAVVSSPMLGLAGNGYPHWMVEAVPGLYAALGQADDFAWGMAKQDPLTESFAHQTLTSDRRRYARYRKIVAADPSLRIGGVTWGWLAAADRSMAKINAPGYGEAIATPLLILGAGHDRLARTDVTRAFAGRVPHAHYVEIAKSEHEIMMETDAIRAQFWQAFDRFTAPSEMSGAG